MSELKRKQLMLVTLNLHSWYPRRYDKKASDEIARNHTTREASEIGRYNKILVDLAGIKPLQKRIAKLRVDHYRFTAPWTDKGDRVLTPDLWWEYTEMYRNAKREINKLADEYAFNEYAKAVEEARTRLGPLFNEDDYPSEVRSRFGCELNLSPLPNPEDVRTWDIDATARAQIEDQVRKSVEASTQAAHQHVVDQVQKRAVEFVEKVRKYDTGDARSFKDTALENLRDITSMVLKGLNINGDLELYKAAEELNDLIAGLEAKELRDDEGASLRISKPAEVEKTIARFAGVFGSTK